MKQSLSSKIVAGVLKVINFKKLIEKQGRKQPPRSKKDFMPQRIQKAYASSVQLCKNKAVATFESKEQVTKNHIIFLHGGAYIFEASSQHWSLAQKIVDKSFCRMTLIDYPLAPEKTYKNTFEMVGAAYEMLIEQYPNDNFILMGDSAGAGLALAFAQKLRKEKHVTLPISHILLSPWLDLTMSNPDIEQLIHTDHVLSVEMLKNAAAKYAGGDNQEHYLLSPIHGELQHLPNTIVFYGTEELFYADCLKLKSIVSAVNKHFIFKEYVGMQHDWAIFPIPESAQVVDDICAFIAA